MGVAHKIKLDATITAVREVRGVTLYVLKVLHGRKEWVIERSFDDFLKLESQLADSSIPFKIPHLPANTYFGIRNFFRGGNFKGRRLERLRRYLEHVLCQPIEILCAMPVMS